MIEMLLLMNLPIVDVQGRKEKGLQHRGRKRKRHGMDRPMKGLEFKYRKAKLCIPRQLCPDIIRQTESLIEPRKVSNRRDETGLVTPDAVDLEFLLWRLRCTRSWTAT